MMDLDKEILTVPVFRTAVLIISSALCLCIEYIVKWAPLPDARLLRQTSQVEQIAKSSKEL